MNLTKNEAATLLFDLLQVVRKDLGLDQRATVALVSTLLTVCVNPGITQRDLQTTVGGLKKSAASRQIKSLGKGTVASKGMGLIVSTPYELNENFSELSLTDRGEEFLAALTKATNRILAKYERRRAQEQ